MLITKPELYLPISKQMLCQIIEGGIENLETTISSLEVPQLASLLLLQNLPRGEGRLTAEFERNLASSIDILNAQSKVDGLSSVRIEIISVINIKNVAEGYKLLPLFKIVLLDEDIIRIKDYLTADAKWDYAFNGKYNEKNTKSLVCLNNNISGGYQTLTADQTRIYREVKAQSDDHMHVQGYAGTGKSLLVKSVISLLCNKKGVNILILAEREIQLKALMHGIDQMDHVTSQTFARLAYEMIPRDLTSTIYKNMRRKNRREAMKDGAIINYFGIMPSGNHSANFIAQVIRSTLIYYCNSGDHSIHLGHIPKAVNSKLDDTTKQVVIYYAEKLWEETLNPASKDFIPPIRGYHLVKYAALDGWQIPDKYTHVIIDECHDLAAPMLQILDSSSQAVISLGDEYQNLRGISQQRPSKIRCREVTHSVRSGTAVESIVKPIISMHPGKTKEPFHGSELSKLDIEYYDKSQLPDKPAVILVDSMWGAFEWAQRVVSKGLNLSLLVNAISLNMFASDCIELYRNGTPPRSGELFRFKDWDQIVNSNKNNQNFQNIDQMLRKGYQHADWQRTYSKCTAKASYPYKLGRVEDVRNHEFDTVMITPEVIKSAWQADSGNLAAVSSAIYVAVTRAKRCLIVPEELRSWIEEISAKKLVVNI